MSLFFKPSKYTSLPDFNRTIETSRLRQVREIDIGNYGSSTRTNGYFVRVTFNETQAGGGYVSFCSPDMNQEEAKAAYDRTVDLVKAHASLDEAFKLLASLYS